MATFELVMIPKVPPSSARGRTTDPRYVQIEEALVKGASHWYLVATCPSSRATGTLSHFLKRRGFESVVRGCDVYARFVP